MRNNPYSGQLIELPDRVYPPLAFLFFRLFSSIAGTDGSYTQLNYDVLFDDSPFLVWISIIFLGCAVFFINEVLRNNLTNKDCNKSLFSFSIVFSLPMLYAFERGNIILISTLLNSIFIFYHDSKNKIIKEIALISLAISAGLKLTPAILGIMLLMNKQWKESIRTVIYGALAFFLPFLAFEGGLANFRLYFENIGLHFDKYYDSHCTIYGCLYSLSLVQHNHFSHRLITYIGYAFAVALIITLPLVKNKWQRVLILSTIMLMIPGVSALYCLVYIFPALVLFINDSSAVEKNKPLLVAFCLLNVFDVLHILYAIAEFIVLIYCIAFSVNAVRNYFNEKSSNKSSAHA